MNKQLNTEVNKNIIIGCNKMNKDLNKIVYAEEWKNNYKPQGSMYEDFIRVNRIKYLVSVIYLNPIENRNSWYNGVYIIEVVDVNGNFIDVKKIMIEDDVDIARADFESFLKIYINKIAENIKYCAELEKSKGWC